MSKHKIEWYSEIDGRLYDFAYDKIRGKHFVTINGQTIRVKKSFISLILGFDEKFPLDTKEARLVIQHGVADIAVDGQFLISEKTYRKRPAWVLIFAVLCLSLIWFAGFLGLVDNFMGASGWVFGTLGMMACVRVSKADLPTAVRMLFCLGIVFLTWLLWFIGIAIAIELGITE